MIDLKDIYRTRIEGEHSKNVRVIETFDDGSEITYTYEKDYPLRYGTNPHQLSTDYLLKEISIRTAEQIKASELGIIVKENPVITLREVKTGKSGMSQTNEEDILRGQTTLKYFSDPACAIMKHLNPCGVAVKQTSTEAFIYALDCDPQAAFGGVAIFNKPINKNVAYATEGHYIEVIGAPDFDEGVIDILNKRKDLRVIQTSGMEKLPKFVGDETIPNIKSYEGRLFFETPYLTKIRSIDDLRNTGIGKLPAIVSEREPNYQELKYMLEAWYVCAAVRSNGIVLWKNGYSVGIGTGQQDRVTAVRQAIAKNKYLSENVIKEKLERGDYSLSGAVIASDGLFPFSDSIEACSEAGIAAVIQPGGSNRDKEVVDAVDKYNMAMIFTGERCFAHH